MLPTVESGLQQTQGHGAAAVGKGFGDQGGTGGEFPADAHAGEEAGGGVERDGMGEAGGGRVQGVA